MRNMRYLLNIPLVLKHKIRWFQLKGGGIDGLRVTPLWLSAIMHGICEGEMV